MEITFVGMYADTSPACVSIIGKAVSEPPPFASLNFAALSNNLLCKQKTSPGYAYRPGGLLNSKDICL